MKLMRMAASAAMMAMVLTASATETDNTEQEAPDHMISLDADARLDWQLVHYKKTDNSQTGFIGKYISLKAHGELTKGLTYTWRQRFSRTPKDNTFWDQTDILDLNYATGKWDFGAGKQVVKVGGYEYDRAPINLMCPNLFVANVACYQFGVSAGYQLTNNDNLSFQISQSFFATSSERNLYSYNLMWRGGRNITDRLRLENIWSINEVEFLKGKYCNYIALGNKLVVDDKYTILLDAMTRTYPDNKAFKNNTFMLECACALTPKWTVTAKCSYDCNRGVNKTDKTEVARGTELTMLGGVAEWYPIKKGKHLLKVHAAAFYSFGENCNPSEMMQKDTFYASVGLTWHMNLFNYK